MQIIIMYRGIKTVIQRTAEEKNMSENDHRQENQ